MKAPAWVLIIAIGAGAAGGCGLQMAGDGGRFVNLTAGAGYDRGLVVCLSGAGAICGEVDRIRAGLAGGGVACAIESFEWSSGSVLADQVGMAANKAKAAGLARRIEKYQDDYPGCPVHLIGVSAGTGLVVWALEDLGPGRRVENVVLLASSLSSGYCLAGALARVGGRVYNHHSAADLVLGVLVAATGTVDRAGGDSGGLHGFRPPEDDGGERLALYRDRLAEVGWRPSDAACGHGGDHLGGTNPAYVRERIASLAWARPPGEQPPAREAAATAVAAAGGLEGLFDMNNHQE